MIEMSKCPQCQSPYESGDRFCQDCGANLVGAHGFDHVFTDAENAAAPSWKQTLLAWIDLGKTPAELILLVAAVAYIASAMAWSNHAQLMANFKLPKIGFQLPKMQFGAPASHGSVLRATIHGAPPKQTADTTIKSIKPKEEKTAVITAEKPGVTTSKQQIAAVPPIAAVPAAAQATAPAKTTAEVAKQRVADRIQQEPAMAKTVASGEELKGLAQYNRLLAEYFSKPHDEKQEPPSYSEWLSSDRQAF